MRRAWRRSQGVRAKGADPPEQPVVSPARAASAEPRRAPGKADSYGLIYSRLPSAEASDETLSSWNLEFKEFTKHLLPFLETRDLATLEAILRDRPALLAHPFAWVQVLHLRRMLRAPDTAPWDAEKIHEALSGLVVAWAEGMLGPRKWRVAASMRRRKGRPPVAGDSEEDWSYLATLVDEAAWWMRRLATFRWRRLAADFREDPEDTIQEVCADLESAWREYRDEFSTNYYVLPGKADDHATLPVGPAQKLIREGFKAQSPKRYIAHGLAGLASGRASHQVRHALKQAKEAGLT